MNPVTLDNSSKDFIIQDQNFFSKITQKIIDFIKEIFNKIYALFNPQQPVVIDPVSLWEDKYCAHVIKVYESRPCPQSEKMIEWVKKYKSHLTGYPCTESFTDADMEAFKISRLGQIFIDNKKDLIKLLTPQLDLPQEFITPGTKELLDKVDQKFKKYVDKYEQDISDSFSEKLKSGNCFGQVLTLSKHLITHGGAIAKLEEENLDKMEQIFFQMNQLIYKPSLTSTPKIIADYYWAKISKKIIEEREGRSAWQKFLHRNELDPRRMEFTVPDRSVEISTQLHKSIFSEFPKPINSEKLEAKEDACLEDQQFRDFVMKSVEDNQGAVAYQIEVEGHAMLLHCNEKSKIFELYDPECVGNVSFVSKEEMVQAMIELSETKKSKIMKVHRFYQAK